MYTIPMMNRKGTEMINFVTASEGKIELISGAGTVLVSSNDVNTLSDTIRSVGFDSDGTYFSSSMDFADEYGFASCEDAKALFDRAVAAV